MNTIILILFFQVSLYFLLCQDLGGKGIIPYLLPKHLYIYIYIYIYMSLFFWRGEFFNSLISVVSLVFQKLCTQVLSFWLFLSLAFRNVLNYFLDYLLFYCFWRWIFDFLIGLFFFSFQQWHISLFLIFVLFFIPPLLLTHR